MADTIQFDRHRGSRPECLHAQALLADAVDGLLSESDEASFDRHIAGCDSCSALLADARRGAAWLEMLKTPRPEPSAQLLERILARTAEDWAGAEGTAAHKLPGFQLAADQLPAIAIQPGRTAPLSLPQPSFAPQGFAPAMQPLPQMEAAGTGLLPFRPRPQPTAFDWRRINRVLLEPRLAMTAAMAFFSIALTLNMAGVHLDQLHARDLKPASLRRSYYEASASAIRHYDSLRVVHVLESRVDDLRESNGADRRLRGVDAPADVPESRRDQPTGTAATPAVPSGGRTTAQPQNGSGAAPRDTPAKDDGKPSGPGMSRRQPLLPEPHLLPAAAETQSSAAPANTQSDPAGGVA